MKEGKVIAIVGLGLIGGSFGKSLRKMDYIHEIIGVDHNKSHREQALELQLVDRCLPINEAIESSDIILLATPVNVIESILWDVLDQVDNQVVFDVGSTKKEIVRVIDRHPKRGRFVACHPMSGTEYSGPKAAIDDLFHNKYNVICDSDRSDQDALKVIESILRDVGMKLLYQEAEAHDTHVAYVSHISHISAFALALTVLNKEESEDQIFQLAGGGFRSSVRLAKSNPATWAPIFEQNRDSVLDVLDEHITVLSRFRSLLIKKDFEKFSSLMEEANQIKRILNK